MIDKTIAVLILCTVTIAFLWPTISDVGHSIGGDPANQSKDSLKKELKTQINAYLPK